MVRCLQRHERDAARVSDLQPRALLDRLHQVIEEPRTADPRAGHRSGCPHRHRPRARAHTSRIRVSPRGAPVSRAPAHTAGAASSTPASSAPRLPATLTVGAAAYVNCSARGMALVLSTSPVLRPVRFGVALRPSRSVEIAPIPVWAWRPDDRSGSAAVRAGTASRRSIDVDALATAIDYS